MLAYDVVGRGKSRKNQHRKPGDMPVKATPETAAKLRPNAVDLLYEAGLIDLQEKTAAEEIRELWERSMAGAFRAVRLDGAGGNPMTRDYHPLDHIPQRLHGNYYRLIAWKRNHAAALPVLWDVLIDGRVPERGDWRLTVLRGALDGWMRMGG